MDEIISEVQKQKWRKNYLSNRYLASLSLSGLESRLDDILINLLFFSKDGSISFDQTSQMNGLVERFVHVDEEMRERGLSINLVNKASEYKEKYPNILKAITVWNDRKPLTGDYLVKFSKKEYLEQMIDFGKIRVSDAGFYNDPSLNLAVRDNELSQTIILPHGTKIRKKMSSGEYEEIKGIQSISLTNNYPENFYVYCLTKTYQHRLFDDFNADACLLIYDLKKFFDRFLNCLKKSYSDWQLKSGDVRYNDPFFPPISSDIPFNKHFRFWYQSEFRIAIKPKKPEEKLGPIYLEIGSLTDCCELITL